MGLPSAQLGSLPSMNVPSSVPVVGVQKSPKIWQQALLNILTQTAGAAATQGIGNVMSQDYAEDPATGWEKLTKGPRMDKSQKMQKTSLDAASTEAEKGRALTRTENEANRILSKSEGIAARNQARELSDKQMALQNHLAAASRMGELERLIQSGQQQKDALSFSDTLVGARDRERYNLDVMSPQNIARTKLTEAETAKVEQAIAQQKAEQALWSGQKPGGPASGGQKPQVNNTGVQVPLGEVLKEMLSSITPEYKPSATNYTQSAGLPVSVGRAATPQQANIPVVRPDIPVVRPDVPVLQPDTQQPVAAVQRSPQETLMTLLQARGTNTPLGTRPGDSEIIRLYNEVESARRSGELLFPNAIWNAPAPKSWK